jgi:CheY-like chemotaxis protein
MVSKIKRILLIEQDEFMRIFLHDVFWLHGADENFEIWSARDLKTARRFIKGKSTRPGLILMDIALPEDRGGKHDQAITLKFLNDLKSNPETKNIKVMMLCDYTDKKRRKQILKLGADEFLVKGEYLPQELYKLAQKLSI